MAPPGSYPIQRAEAELGLQSIGGPPWPPVAHDPDGWMAALGSLPLMYQPGEQWLYNTSAQVLGVLLARACGRGSGVGAAGTHLRSARNGRHRVHGPGRTSWAGSPPPTAPDPETGELSVLDDPADSWWSTPHVVPRRQRLAGLDHRRLLVVRLDAAGRRRRRRAGACSRPETVALMTTDRLTPEQREASALFLDEHGGWGLGLEVPAAGMPAARCRAGSAGTAAPAPPGARASAAASPASSSPSAASPRPWPSRWPWTSGPGVNAASAAA